MMKYKGYTGHVEYVSNRMLFSRNSVVLTFNSHYATRVM